MVSEKFLSRQLTWSDYLLVFEECFGDGHIFYLMGMGFPPFLFSEVLEQTGSLEKVWSESVNQGQISDYVFIYKFIFSAI